MRFGVRAWTNRFAPAGANRATSLSREAESRLQWRHADRRRGARFRAARPDRHPRRLSHAAGRRAGGAVLLPGRDDRRLHQGGLPLPRPRGRVRGRRGAARRHQRATPSRSRRSSPTCTPSTTRCSPTPTARSPSIFGVARGGLGTRLGAPVKRCDVRHRHRPTVVAAIHSEIEHGHARRRGAESAALPASDTSGTVVDMTSSTETPSDRRLLLRPAVPVRLGHLALDPRGREAPRRST